MSGKHKHGNGKHKHNKQQLLIDKLDKEGIKLLVKGKLKHIPNITIRQPTKKTRDYSKKKEDLEEMAREIKKNIKEFEGKKNVVERVMGGGGSSSSGGSVSVQVPVHIPQFSVPENPSKNNLNDINNTILETENDLREFYERENEGRSFLEIEEIYEDNPDEFDDLPDLEAIDQGESDILPEDENESDRMIREAQLDNVLPVSQAIEPPIEAVQPQPRNDDINRLRELFQDMRDRPSGIPIIEEPESDDDNQQQLAIEAPPEQLAIESAPPYNPIQYLPPPPPPVLRPVQQNLDDWTEIPDYLQLPPSILSNVYRPPPSRSLMDNISDVVDIAEGTILNWFSEPKPRKLALNQSQTEFEAYDRTDDDAKLFLQTINSEQDELIKLKNEELKEKQELLKDMENVNKFNEEDLNNLENEIGKSISAIETMKEGKEKDDKIKEAQILSLQLEGFEKQEELRDTIQALNLEIDDTKNELNNLKTLQKPSKLGLSKGQNEFENISQFQLSSDEQEQLEIKRNREAESERLSQNFQQLGIRHNIGSYNNIIKLEQLRQQIGDEMFVNITNSIYRNGNSREIPVRTFLTEMEAIINRNNERNFEQEEELQRQIIRERVNEDEYENNQLIINQIKNDIDNNKSELDKKKTTIENKINELEIYTQDLNEVETEYDNLVSTLELEFERNDINSIEEIDEIEDERDRENILALWSYINVESKELNDYIQEMKNRIKLEQEDIINLESDYNDNQIEYDRQKTEYERILRSLN
mgnify:CR=1 FL=1